MINTHTKRRAVLATTAAAAAVAAVAAGALASGGGANAAAATSSGPCTSGESLPTTYPAADSSLVHTGSCTNVVRVSIARWGFDPPCAQVSPPGPEAGAYFPGAGQAPGYVC